MSLSSEASKLTTISNDVSVVVPKKDCISQ